MARVPLQAEQTGVTHFRLRPGRRSPFSHRHVNAEEVYVILAGSGRPEVRQLRERLAGTAGHGATVYARDWPAADPSTAALLNGTAGRAIELCEGLRLVSGQAALQVLPGVLAVGEEVGSSGRDIMAAFVLGYEIAGRLDVSVKSAETYKARGVEKLGLKTRAELVRYASMQGWLTDI